MHQRRGRVETDGVLQLAPAGLEGRPARAVTRHGTVRATYVLRATEGFTATLPGLRRTWLPMNSSMIVTEPLPARAWEQIGWSGAETIAHLRENGRIVLMFCAFDGPPNIVRLHGRGRVVLLDDPEFDQLRPAFAKERELGQRSIVVVDVERVSDSCGYAVPLMDLREDRDLLDRHQERRDPTYFDDYWRTRNATIECSPAIAPRIGPGPAPPSPNAASKAEGSATFTICMPNG